MERLEKISAYLVYYEDPDFLDDAIRSVSELVDEIVVVDGSYAWLAPFFKRLGLDPVRSSEASMDIFERWRTTLPIKYHSGVWANELEKREFGYLQCTHSKIYLFDADEIHDINPDAWTDYMSSDKPIAHLLGPGLVTPDLAWRKRGNSQFGLRCTVFDARRIGAKEHLDYLWLVLPGSERNQRKVPNNSHIHRDPVGTFYHLPAFRTRASAVNRARFYILNNIRETKRVPWLGNLELEEGEFERILDIVSVRELDDYLAGTALGLGFRPDKRLEHAPVRISPRWKATIDSYYERHKLDVAASSRLSAGRSIVAFNGVPVFLDTTELARRNPGTRATVVASEIPKQTKFVVHFHLLTRDGDVLVIFGHADAVGDAIHVTLPDGATVGRALRVFVSVRATWPSSDPVFLRYTAFRA